MGKKEMEMFDKTATKALRKQISYIVRVHM